MLLLVQLIRQCAWHIAHCLILLKHSVIYNMHIWYVFLVQFMSASDKPTNLPRYFLCNDSLMLFRIYVLNTSVSLVQILVLLVFECGLDVLNVACHLYCCKLCTTSLDTKMT